MPPTDHGTSAPSSIESDGSGTTSSGSISCCVPRPVQRGHAPCGALKEKIRGWSSGSETPWSGHAKFWLNSSCSPVSTRSTATSPSERPAACSIDCVKPRPQVGAHHEPVDDDLDRVLELLVESRDALLEDVLLAVDLHAREALADQILEDVLVLALAVAHDRRVDREARSLLELRAPGRRSRRGSGRRSACRRPGSAAGRRARTRGAGSRRSP